MTALIRNVLVLASVLALAFVCAAQTVERIGRAPSDLPEPIRHAVEEKGYRIPLTNGLTADLWFAKELNLPQQDKTSPDALYPQLPPSAFVGILKIGHDMPDYRGQAIRAGTYTLRYELLPQDGNHLGVSPNPDFLLAIPASDDPNPIQPWVLKKVVEMSAKSTGGSHPAVIAMETAGEPATVAKTDAGAVFSVAIPSASGTQRIGICLTCAASQ